MAPHSGRFANDSLLGSIGRDLTAYLVHVLQSIDTHPAAQVADLTPRLWKEHFAGAPMRSEIDRGRATLSSVRRTP